MCREHTQTHTKERRRSEKMSHSLSSWVSSCIQMLCNISPWTSYTMPTSIRFRVIHVFAQYTPRESTTPILHHCHTNAWCVYAFNSTCKLIHYWTEPNRTVRFLETANIEVLLFIQKLRTITIATMKWERIYTEPEIKAFEVKYVIELLLAYTRTKY